MRVASLFGAGALVVLAACGSASSPAASRVTNAATSTTSATLACAPERTDCTPDQVIATVTRLYEIAGATPAEAACLAPVTATGTHAVNQAFDVPTPAQNRAAVACTGTKVRLLAIMARLADYFSKQLPIDIPDTVPPIPCTTWKKAATAASAVFYANTTHFPTTFTDLTAGNPPALELTEGVTVTANTVKGNGWTLTMSGGGSKLATFACS